MIIGRLIDYRSSDRTVCQDLSSRYDFCDSYFDSFVTHFSKISRNAYAISNETIQKNLALRKMCTRQLTHIENI